MKIWGEILTKHRNLFLFVLLVTTLALSGIAHHTQRDSTTVNIPIMQTMAEAVSPLEKFRQERDAAVLKDLAALETLVDHPDINDETRQQAALQLQRIIDIRQAQKALEGALTSSSLSPCIAVLEGGSLTIVTEKPNLTDKDSTLVLTLAAAHTDVAPENVRVMTTN